MQDEAGCSPSPAAGSGPSGPGRRYRPLGRVDPVSCPIRGCPIRARCPGPGRPAASNPAFFRKAAFGIADALSNPATPP